MTKLQAAFLSELKSNPKFTVAEYAALYKKHSKIAIEHEEIMVPVSIKQRLWVITIPLLSCLTL